MCQAYPTKGLPEMCSTITRLMTNGFELSGQTIMPELWIPYYDKNYIETQNWDRAKVNQITIDDPYAKQNQGLAAWDLNGTKTFINESQLLPKIQWVLNWNGLPESERIIAICKCSDNGNGDVFCGGPGGTGLCGVKFFTSGPDFSCNGNCGTKIKASPF